MNKLGFAYLRGLVLVIGASLVLSALITCMVVKMACDVAAGIGVQSGDWTTILVAAIGGGLVMGIAGRAVWRERASLGWAVYGVIFGLVIVVGTVGGAIAGTRISDEHVAYVQDGVRTTCAEFAAVHPDHAAGCEDRVLDCRNEVRASPPVVERGLHAADAIASSEPRNPVERAVWACLAR